MRKRKKPEYNPNHYDYVKRRWNKTYIGPTLFGQRGLDRYIEVIIVGERKDMSDIRLRLGKRHCP